jgi:hypothetical protein
MSNEQPISKLTKYFLTELSAVLYLLGVNLEEATQMFQKAYCEYAIQRRGTQLAAASALGIHRNLLGRIINKGLGAGTNRGDESRAASFENSPAPNTKAGR